MSPFRRTLRQLLADRLAVVAAALLALIVALCAAAPWISGDAETLRPWIGALPPGSTTPDWPVDGSIAPGAQLAIPSDVTRLRIRLRAPATEHRAVVRQGRVDLRLGATPVHELPLAGLLIERNGETIAAPATVLRHGEPPPAAVFPPGVRVALLRDQPPELEPIVLALRDGLVQSAETADGVAVRDVRVSGDRVLALHAANADGRERLLTRFHPLGTDAMGRDLWARLLHGGQLSLMVAVVASLVSLAIGVAWGATAGFLGGRADRALMGTVDVLYALPFLFLVILLLVLFGRNLVVLFAALGVVQWLTTARIVRASVLSLATREFVAAARAGGLSEARILARHILPHCVGPTLVALTLTVPLVMLEESFLAFIGLTVQYDGRNLDSWGALVKSGLDHLGSDGDRSWLLIAPATAMVVTLMCLVWLGDALRDACDPKHDGGVTRG